MVIFFLGMCREAGIPTLDVPRQRTMRNAARPPASVQRTGNRTPKESVRADRRTVTSSGVVPAALEGLVKSLPAAGTPLSASRRQQWLKMAEATLAYVYPEPGETVELEEEEAGQ
jgi:hypothetical protein